jgi:putative membrane protein
MQPASGKTRALHSSRRDMPVQVFHPFLQFFRGLHDNMKQTIKKRGGRREMRKSAHRRGEDEGDVLKGLAAGLIGGLVASWTMNQFQAMLGKHMKGVERSHGAQSLQQGKPDESEKIIKLDNDEEQDDATERLASAIAENIFGRELTKPEKETAGTVVHYAYGTVTGAMYGVAAELAPAVTAGAGLPFGALVWISMDEGIVPALGLSKSAEEYPLSTHVYAFTSHLFYGLTAEVVRRAVRKAL